MNFAYSAEEAEVLRRVAAMELDWTLPDRLRGWLEIDPAVNPLDFAVAERLVERRLLNQHAHLAHRFRLTAPARVALASVAAESGQAGTVLRRKRKR